MNLLKIPVLLLALTPPLTAQRLEEPDPAGPKIAEKLNAFPLQIPDGSAVVLKNGDTIGVIFITNQLNGPEQCDFHWMLRADGAFDFGEKAKGLEEGHEKAAKVVKFGPFELEWSMGSKGHGWVYFPEDGTFMGVLVGVKREDLVFKLPFVPMLRNVTADRIELKEAK